MGHVAFTVACCLGLRVSVDLSLYFAVRCDRDCRLIQWSDRFVGASVRCRMHVHDTCQSFTYVHVCENKGK
jgi:hypothetical protein